MKHMCYSDLRHTFSSQVHSHLPLARHQTPFPTTQTLCFAKQQRCVKGNATALILNLGTPPKATIHPALLEGDLTLSHVLPPSGEVESSGAISISSTGNGSGVENAEVLNKGVVWRVEALPLDTMKWTIFPSTGLLLPGARRVWCEP